MTAWRFFPVEVRALDRLSPAFLRVTFTGGELERFADNGYDQRIKFVLPLREHGLAHLPRGDNWYAQWRALPAEHRNPVRTYTVRAVRPHQREVDVDMVLHGATGPASAWAEQAHPGSPACLLGPDAQFSGDHGGLDYRPSDAADFILLGGDETAVPAIAAILERMPAGVRGEAFLEVPSPADRLPLRAAHGVRVTWLPRNGEPHGSRLIPAVREATGRSRKGDIDLYTDDRFYAWLAGEAAVVRSLRHHLVADCGVDRRSVAFMGYWRRGRAEAYA